MGEGKRVSLLPLYVVFAVIACASLQLCASDSVRFAPFSTLLCMIIFHFLFLCIIFGLQIFYESFDDDFEGRWIVSEKEDYKG